MNMTEKLPAAQKPNNIRADVMLEMEKIILPFLI